MKTTGLITLILIVATTPENLHVNVAMDCMATPSPQTQENSDKDSDMVFNDQAAFEFFKELFSGNEYAAAGACGNMKLESSMLTNNAENAWNNKTGYSDDWLTTRLNNYITRTEPYIDLATFLQRSWYVNPIGFGYGLSQWTEEGRRTELWNRTIGSGINIDNLEAQKQYIYDEFTGNASSGNYAGVRTAMVNATSVREATSIYCRQYEGGGWSETRFTYAMDFYNRFAGGTSGYAINITVEGNGKSWASVGEIGVYYAEAGTRVQLAAVPNDDDYFLLWTVDYPSSLQLDFPVTVANNEFTMPNSKVDFTAHFTGDTPEPPPYPPVPPTPLRYPQKRKGMPIWMYPIFRV